MSFEFRIKGWEKRFIHEIQFVLQNPFDWATNNCGHTIAAAIRACHNDHPVLQYLAKCRDETSTLAVLGEEGGLKGILEGYFTRLPTPLLGQQADVGLIKGKFWDVHQGEYVESDVGCVFLDGIAVGLREKGVFRIPISKVEMAFSI